MAVQLPTNSETFPFSTEIDVRLGDLSSGFHLSNHMIVGYMNEVMVRLFKVMGFDGLLINDVSFINRDLEISYCSKGCFTEHIKVDVAIESFEEEQYTPVFRFYNSEPECEWAHVRGVFASFNYRQRKIVPLPAELIEAYRALSEKSQ